MQFSVCLLFYGDHPELAHRCLDSIWQRLAAGKPYISDIRIGLNVVSDASRQIIDWFVAHASGDHKLPVITYESSQNVCKYPLMRRMALTDPQPPAELLMWFDDDSYLCGDDGWWERLRQVMQTADMAGKLYRMAVQGSQREWVATQPWYNPEAGPPEKFGRYRGFRYCTGGWWTIRSQILCRWDWPPRVLRHCGGDALLGELLRQQGLRLVNFEEGVRINADERGRHSGALRRGVDEAPLGKYPASWFDESFQNFTVRRHAVGYGDARDGDSQL